MREEERWRTCFEKREEPERRESKNEDMKEMEGKNEEMRRKLMEVRR